MNIIKITLHSLILFLIIALIHSVSCKDLPQTTSTPIHTYKIVKEYPHNHSFFTQGLVYEDGFVYEGTGLRGLSRICKVDLTTGRIVKSRSLKRRFFGEGITILKDKIYQLTWKSKTGFIYDKNTFDLVGKFKYRGQGWGLTNNGKHLIMSNGSETLAFIEPQNFKIKKKIKVYDQFKKINNINELEYINGQIYANIWPTQKIAVINPEDGKVTSWIDLKGLLAGYTNIPNGIAYDQDNKRLFVTGKNWHKLFEIQIIKKKSSINLPSKY